MEKLLKELQDIKECSDITQEVDPRDFIRVIEIIEILLNKSK